MRNLKDARAFRRRLLAGAVLSGALALPAAAEPIADRDPAQLFDPAVFSRQHCVPRGALAPANLWLTLAEAGTPATAAETPVRLYDDLGTRSFPVTAKGELVQAYFDQGLRLTYAFNHFEAVRAYKEAQKRDPACAMCYWGEAYVLGPNLNVPMGEDAVAPAIAAIGAAMAKREGASPKERALIEALALRYTDDPEAPRAPLDKAYAEAMTKVAAAYPDDLDIQTLYADALMNLSPWDYWEADKKTPHPAQAEVVPTLERVLAADPTHPGAIHLYIHAVEASVHAPKAEPHADRLAAQMPGAGHIVHMPAHIYYVLGRYADSVAANIKAVAADEAYIAEVKPDSVYTLAYYPHNVHFVVTSATMLGDAQTAVPYADKLEGLIPDEIARTAHWPQPIKAAPLLARLQLGLYDEVLAAPSPAADMPYLKAMWHYARGVAFALTGKVAEAKAEKAALEKLTAENAFEGIPNYLLPARQLVELSGTVLDARIAAAEGRPEDAVGLWRTAVSQQDAVPYTEPPFWYYPTRQSLGAALVTAGKADEASEVLKATLHEHPNNGWALFALARAYEAMGDEAAADATQAAFAKSWTGGRMRPHLGAL